MGTSNNELNSSEIKLLGDLYKQFDAVSVREYSALKLFDSYKWKIPTASIVVDPTLLLTKDDYIMIISEADTHPSKGNLFCYILDKDVNKDILIEEKSNELGLIPFGLNIIEDASVEQWLRSF